MNRPPWKPLLILLASCLMAGALGVVPPGGPGPTAEAAGTPPDIIFIVTDDQRWDSMQYMPNVKKYLSDEGVSFSNAYVTNALCCPSRVSNLTGNYSHSTGVWKNSPPFGGFKGFDDSSSLATWLDPTYTTALMGKYLNGYLDMSYVPPGWDEWFAFDGSKIKYYDFKASANGVPRHFPSSRRNYAMRVLQRRAVNFIQDTKGPLFLFLTPPAPHQPSTPAHPDRDAFPDWVPPRPPNYNEADVSDKPAWVQALPPGGKRDPEQWDQLALNMTRSLLAVDRSIAKIVATLQETGRLDNTMIIFTSDNGIGWGEHRWYYKDSGFEENIRVPLVVRYDPAIGKPHEDESLMVNIDNASTIAETAGLSKTTQGTSYLPLLEDPAASWRSSFLLEHMAPRSERDPTRVVPSFCGIHTGDSKYLEYTTGEKELYDLVADPYELENLADDPSHSAMQATLAAELSGMCQPIPELP